jgi:hypothetical protein
MLESFARPSRTEKSSAFLSFIQLLLPEYGVRSGRIVDKISEQSNLRVWLVSLGV